MRVVSNIKAFFFDLDGTLVDTHEANYLAYQQAIVNVIGKEAPEELRELIRQGRSSKEFLPLLLTDIDTRQVDAINEQKRDTYRAFASHSTPNNYLVEFLRNMSKHHVTALVTTAKRPNAETILKAHNLEACFTFCIFGDEVKRMKPDPEAYLLAVERAKVGPEEVLVFEDSEKGIEAAKAAGLKVIHVRDFL